jgi:hypothetical protein
VQFTGGIMFNRHNLFKAEPSSQSLKNVGACRPPELPKSNGIGPDYPYDQDRKNHSVKNLVNGSLPRLK